MSHPANPFSVVTPNIAVAKIVDRTVEIKELCESLMDRRENALVTGDYGVGKTCLLRKLRSELTKQNGRTLLYAEMDHEILSQGATHFLRNAVIQLCGAAYEYVFNQPATDLLNSLRGDISVAQRLQERLNSFLEIFQLARPDVLRFTNTRANETGAALVVSGKISETFSAARDVQLLSSEFLGIATKLLRFVAADGVTHVIIFADEANHIETETEVDIIRQNLEAFSARNVQFVFTFKKGPTTSTPLIRDAFAHVAEVHPFRSIDDLRTLFNPECEECSDVHVHFDDAVLERLFRATGGHPRQLQLLGVKIWQRAMADKRNHANMTDVVDALLDGYTMMPR